MALFEFTPEERAAFLSRLKRNLNTGCLEWTRGKTGKGYGAFRYRGRTLGAHRLAYMLFIGEIPDGLVVCHKCNNRLCCDPSHIYAGTQMDNMADAVAAGHRNYGTKNYRVQNPPKGEKHPQSTLTDAQVSEIIDRFNIGAGRSEYGLKQKLAKEYGVSVGTIRHIRYGETWKHLL